MTSWVKIFKLGMSTMYKKGARPIVICGPSGSGKSTLLKRLFDDHPDIFAYSISHTTRKPRKGEVDGKHYYFTTKEKMQEDIQNGKFLESAQFSGNLYGTSLKAVDDIRNTGKICILEVEIEGVKQIKQSSLQPSYVFIQPPSMTELEKRLRNRQTESEESLQARLTTAKTELKYAEGPGNFDIIVVNDNFDSAYKELCNYIFEIQREQV